ncbi:STAS domain-containing protein [Streptomyces sp. NPDC087917]|uniref:STAS domain-containing protein n=1 Tax=Streptomyces sp. NPDC087917 TaxID=3155060 RepID=UPI00343BCE08
MTMLPTGRLRLTRVDADATVRIELHGDLDHESAGALLDAVDGVLAEAVGPRELHLGCADLAAVDSSGLSTLLMIRRLTDAADVRLRLGERPVRLDRMLRVTGTLDHLTAPEAGGRSGSSSEQSPSAASEESIPARSSSPDTSS